ncbi:MAG TPA: ABC transporter substrate-binding protein, partial [Ktedonobacterales bacterium]
MASSTFSLAQARGRRVSTSLIVTFLGAVSLLVTACGGTSNAGTATKHTLTAICSVGGSYTENMSPFSPNVNCGVDGLVYENLEYVNGVSGKETPMLGTSYTWGANNTTLTFKTRQGVNWSDSKPFSANDVAFTFNMLKTYPTADGNGLWQHLASVTASDA